MLTKGSYKNKNYERLNNSISYEELIGDFAIFVQSNNFVDRELSELKEEKFLPNNLSDAISEYQNFLDNLPENDSKVKVAVESSEDFEDLEVNFTTYHYPDGREGVRYRLVISLHLVKMLNIRYFARWKEKKKKSM